MTIYQTIALALLQGITEFLPISSSGHLVLLRSFLHIDPPPLLFDVSLHFGSALALLFFFRTTWIALLHSIFNTHLKKERKLLINLFLASLPVVAIGLFLKNQIELLASPLFVSIGMGLVGLLYILTEIIRSKKKMLQKVENLSFFQTISIGFFQAIGLLPGISRSGITTIGGMWQGVHRQKAAEFSFLLGTPAILGATALSALDLLQPHPANSMPWPQLVLGIIISTLVSLLVITFLLKFFQHQSMTIFGIYLLVITSFVLFSQIFF